MKTLLRQSARFVAVILGMTSVVSMKAQITTSNLLTPAQLVQNVLLGPGIIASNITYTGYADAIGVFYGGNSGVPVLGIDSGIVMTTGTILANDLTLSAVGQGPQGPNNSTGAGVDNLAPGDAYMDGLAGTSTFNACILEFDFVAASDSVKFNYVFGTDEYMEWISGGFADVFAFVLNGVTTTLAPTNIALIPSTTTAVTALNVNANINSAYYVDNETPPGTTIQYDGFTTVLTAKYPIICGETYHIKLAVADAIDGVVDAGVYLQAGSFTTSAVNVSSEISYGSSNDSTLYEGCGTACITLSRAGNLTLADTVNLSVTGTALNGVDFTPALPSQIIFLPGQDSITICVSATQDNIAEGLETLTLTSTDSGACASTVTNLTIYISDFADITVDAGNDTALCNSSPITINTVVTGGVMPYSYIWSTGATTSSITVTPTQSTFYIVTVTDGCGTPQGSDTVAVFIPSGALATTPTPDLVLCTGDPAFLGVSITGGSLPYVITWTTLTGPDQVPNPGSATNQFTPTANGTFVVEVREGCGAFRFDTIEVSIHDCSVVPPNVFTPNGDGTNDVLVFTGLQNFPGSGLIIYNRWGNKIYESADYQNDWNGSTVSDGVYYYILTQSDGKNLTGFVTILRGK